MGINKSEAFHRGRVNAINKNLSGPYKIHFEPTDDLPYSIYGTGITKRHNCWADKYDARASAERMNAEHREKKLNKAAPDLLAAAQKWLAHYDGCVRDKQIGDEPGIAELRAAIIKATS